MPASTTTLFSLAVGSVLTPPVAVITAERHVPSAQAVIVLGLVCTALAFTALAFTLYYSLIDQVGEVRAAIVNYPTPIFALFYGVVLLGEHLTIAAVAGLALIIVGGRSQFEGIAPNAPEAKRKSTNTGRIHHSTRVRQAGNHPAA